MHTVESLLKLLDSTDIVQRAWISKKKHQLANLEKIRNVLECQQTAVSQDDACEADQEVSSLDWSIELVKAEIALLGQVAE